MTICCINYNHKTAPADATGSTPAPLAYMDVYPNPTTGQMTIKYQMATKEKVTIVVYDMVGRQVAEWHPGVEDNTQTCYYAVPTTAMDWPSGVYLVQLSNGRQTFKTKLTITK